MKRPSGIQIMPEGAQRSFAVPSGPVAQWFDAQSASTAQREHSTFRLKLTVQRLKFLGHWLETVSKMQAMGLFVPDAVQLTTIEGAAQNLVVTVNDLQKQGAFDKLPEIRAKDEQIYLDIIGDSGHAVRGLELALGRGKVAW